MTISSNLTFAMTKAWTIYGITIPADLDRDALAATILSALNQRDTAVCTKSSLTAVTDWTATATPPQNVTDAITQIDTDLNLPTPPA